MTRPTIEGLLQLDPVLVDKVAVVLPVPEARVALQLPDVRLEASHRTAAWMETEAAVRREAAACLTLPPAPKRTRAVHAVGALGVLHGVPMQVSVQAEAGPAVASDPLQLGQVGGRRSLPVALGDPVHRHHTLTREGAGAARLEAQN